MSEAISAGDALPPIAPEFHTYFVQNYPGPDTIIYSPEWHAPRIWRAAISAYQRALAQTAPAVQPVAYVCLQRWKTRKFWPDDCFSETPSGDQLDPLYSAQPVVAGGAQEAVAPADSHPDVAMLLRRLVRRLKVSGGDDDLCAQATEYMRKHNLMGSIIRAAAPSAPQADDATGEEP